MEVAGTSEILGILSRERHATPGVVSFLPIDGLYLHAGPTQAARRLAQEAARERVAESPRIGGIDEHDDGWQRFQRDGHGRRPGR